MHFLVAVCELESQVAAVKLLNPYLEPDGLSIRHLTFFNSCDQNDVTPILSSLAQLLTNRSGSCLAFIVYCVPVFCSVGLCSGTYV